MKKEEADMQSLKAIFREFKPFWGDYMGLSCISTNDVAPEDLKCDIATATKTVTKVLKMFVETYLVEHLTTKFHDTIPKVKSKTFTNLSQRLSTVIKCS